MKKLERIDAIKVLVEFQIKNLSLEERENLLLDWWSIDEDDPEFDDLPIEIQKEILNNDEPQNIVDEKYNCLLSIALNNEYRGVKNSFILNELKPILNKELLIIGEVDKLEKCPCCEYRTIVKTKAYEVCPVCFWEDDGSSLDKYSSCNRMTLKEGKENFKKYKSCNSNTKTNLDYDPELKFFK